MQSIPHCKPIVNPSCSIWFTISIAPCTVCDFSFESFAILSFNLSPDVACRRRYPGGPPDEALKILIPYGDIYRPDKLGN